MIDPLIIKLVSLGFAVLFLTAAWHKFADYSAFTAALANYQLLPGVTQPVIAPLLPVAELLLGAAWLFQISPQLTATASVIVLGAYTIGIAINLARGRTWIDCGCGFGRGASNEQPLSAGLVLRNVLLIAIAGLPILSPVERSLVVADYLVMAVALTVSMLLFAGAGQLISNRAAINTWRKK